jgi:hypothetical protein
MDARDVPLGVLVLGTRIALAPLRLAAETLTAWALAAPELQRAIDRALAGPLTDAVARSISEHKVPERVASQVLAQLDFGRIVDAVLEDRRTELALDHALESPAMERLVVRVLESRLLDDVTDHVIQSPEFQRIVEHVAASPEILAAVSHHTETLAEEMVADVRRRSQRVDDIAERTVRSWLRRPRPNPS